MANSNDIVFYHYGFSPYSQKVAWYLTLRGINYAECVQPITMPRPDLALLGVKYRRIPLLAHGRDVFCDTRLITAHLDTYFPPSSAHPGLAPTSPPDQAYARLLEKWVIEGGIFNAAAGALPATLPTISDPNFQKDRAELTGRSWSADAVRKGRPAAAVILRDAFATIEEQVLGDGRHWVLGGDGPSRADIDLIWPVIWLSKIPGALDFPALQLDRYPKLKAWVDRFQQALANAKKRNAANAKPESLKGDEAAKRVLAAGFVSEGKISVDAEDPHGYKEGQLVESGPADWGFRAKDVGKVVGLSREEIVLEVEAPEGKGKKVRVHHPRLVFVTRPVDGAKL